jgi:crotonobetainyl-CoA:carnitine CoA-transferase CaiB-like acyl-CoA transferase
MGGALAHLRVIEYGEFVSGPYCGKLLGDLGAHVIKIEKPGTGDKARSRGPFPRDIPHPERSGLFLYLNTNKCGITLDIGNGGKEIFQRLIKWADVFIENYPIREIKKLGLDYESLHAINPGLVVISITPFGQTGTYRNYKGCNLISYHTSGMAHMIPYEGAENIEEQPPLAGAAHSGDLITGLTAAICTMSAVIARGRTGLGQHVDVSAQESLASLTRRELGIFTYEGLPWRRARGLRGVEVAMLPCKDGHVVLVPTSDAFWKGMVAMMDSPEWAMSELFHTRLSRRQNWDAIELMAAEWTSQRTVEEVNQAAQEKHVPCMPVYQINDVVEAEQLAFRRFFVEIDRKEAGKVKYPGAPYKLSETPWEIRCPAPLLGEHNEEVYGGLLGYSKQDLARMKQAKII